MKKHTAILGAIALVLGVGVASAQEHHFAPLPKPPDGAKQVRFPAPAAQYDKYIQWFVTLLRTLPARYNVPQSEGDVVIVLLKDCASRIEADGIVTKDESKYCENITMAKLHEIVTPYVMERAGGGN